MKQGSIVMAMIWMAVLSLLLFWLPLVGPLVARFGARRVATFGLGFGPLSYLILAFAPDTRTMILGIVVGACSAVTFSAMQQLIDDPAGARLMAQNAARKALDIGNPEKARAFWWVRR